MEVDFCTCITANFYFKVFYVLIVGLVLTFADQMQLLQSRDALLLIIGITLLMIFTRIEEYGAIVLLMALLVITYNLNTNHNLKATLLKPNISSYV